MMADTTDKDYAEEKGPLRKAQTDEVRALEKLKKKKKGVHRDAVQQQIDTAEARHIQELTVLAEKYGKPLPSKSAAKQVDKEEKPKGVMFPELKWSTLGKKDLEEECARRSISKKGTKEELVCRLIVFTQSQEVAARNESTSESDEVERELNTPPIRKDSTGGVGGLNELDDTAGRMVIPDFERNTTKKIRGRGRKLNKRGRGRGSRGGGRQFNNNDSSDGGNNRPRGADDSSSSGSDDDDDDAREKKNKKKDENKPRKGEKGDVEDAEDETELSEEDLRKQKQRRNVMRNVLINVMKNNEKGLHVDSLLRELQKMKVSNFRPELLGYPTIEAWLRAQRQDVVIFDEVKGRLLPPGALPSSDGSSESDGSDDNANDSNDSENESD